MCLEVCVSYISWGEHVPVEASTSQVSEADASNQPEGRIRCGCVWVTVWVRRRSADSVAGRAGGAGGWSAPVSSWSERRWIEPAGTLATLLNLTLSSPMAPAMVTVLRVARL